MIPLQCFYLCRLYRAFLLLYWLGAYGYICRFIHLCILKGKKGECIKQMKLKVILWIVGSEPNRCRIVYLWKFFKGKSFAFILKRMWINESSYGHFRKLSLNVFFPLHTFYQLKWHKWETKHSTQMEKGPNESRERRSVRVSVIATKLNLVCFPKKLIVKWDHGHFQIEWLILHFVRGKRASERNSHTHTEYGTLSCISVVNWYHAVQCKVIVKRLWSNIIHEIYGSIGVHFIFSLLFTSNFLSLFFHHNYSPSEPASTWIHCVCSLPLSDRNA